MKDAGRNRSFAATHRAAGREWEKSGWNYMCFEDVLYAQEINSPAKISEKDEWIKCFFPNSKYINGATWRARAMELVDHQSHQGLLSCSLLMQRILFIEPSAASAMSGRFSRTIYVGNLPLDVRESEIDDLFFKYGRIVDIELKIPPRPPAYCFVEFEKSRDAEDAIRGRDGYSFDGHYLRVELAHGGRGPPSVVDRRGGYGSGGGGRHGVSRHSEYRVIVRNLPSSASWQDLKDHMRKAGDVCFVEVYRDGGGTVGLVDYTNHEDMKYAIRKLDDTEFKNPFSKSYIRVESHKGSPPRSRSRSRSRTPRRERSISSERPVSRSASKSVSSRSRSASPARLSRSRSS